MINRQSVIDVLQERQNYYAERNESKQMFAIVNAIDDVLNLPSANPWHTGTPTEEGWYLLKLVDEYGRITYDANYLRNGIKGMEWKYAFFGHIIIKWQSIEDEPEVMMG